MDLERFMAWEAAGGMENSDFRTETDSGRAYLVWEAAVAAERERCIDILKAEIEHARSIGVAGAAVVLVGAELVKRMRG